MGQSGQPWSGRDQNQVTAHRRGTLPVILTPGFPQVLQKQDQKPRREQQPHLPHFPIFGIRKLRQFKSAKLHRRKRSKKKF
jgi:hypothetical protein